MGGSLLHVKRAIHGRYLLTDHGDRITAACIACLTRLGEVSGPADLLPHDSDCQGDLVELEPPAA